MTGEERVKLEAKVAELIVENRALRERAERLENRLANLETAHAELKADAFDGDGVSWLDRCAAYQRRAQAAEADVKRLRAHMTAEGIACFVCRGADPECPLRAALAESTSPTKEPTG